MHRIGREVVAGLWPSRSGGPFSGCAVDWSGHSYEGNTNVKWLRRLKLGTEPFQTREETSKYSMLMPDGAARQFNLVMEAKSVITFPSGGQRLEAPGFYEISGLAWTGSGKVARVEVTTDGGASWRDAALQEPIMSKCLTRFRAPWNWDGAPARVASRVTDETGYVQPSRETLLKVRDVRSYYHYNANSELGRRGRRRGDQCWLNSSARPSLLGDYSVRRGVCAAERYDFGRPATPAEIAGWDIDVSPDGAGLPAGTWRRSAGEGDLRGEMRELPRRPW